MTLKGHSSSATAFTTEYNCQKQNMFCIQTDSLKCSGLALEFCKKFG